MKNRWESCPTCGRRWRWPERGEGGHANVGRRGAQTSRGQPGDRHRRYAGSGWLAAPRANPEDGLLDLVVIEDVGVQEVLKLAPTCFGRLGLFGQRRAFFARAKEIRVETTPGSLEFTVDGEIIGDEPARSR